MLFYGITCEWVLFPTIDLYIFISLNRFSKVYNTLVSACTVKAAMEMQCLCVLTSKKMHFCRASSFLNAIIEDTHLTLAAISLKVETNNSLIFCKYKYTTKKLPSFRSFSVKVYVCIFITSQLQQAKQCKA